MKNFRKAALAIATASTVALGSTAVASAEDAKINCENANSDTQVNLTGPCKDEDATKKILGSDQGISGKGGFGLTQTTDQPGWWILTKTLTYGAFVGVIASVGIAIGNYLKNQGIII
ncbi:hypothetical protein [Corynebacterium sp. ACRQJ]|uniref:hypothetical protein n=1 Tax=Corynebacterium TaxID=1716 RepID=UPI001EF70646|nr:hypothetical protein [Corynebacterium sp. ACRQJ]MCG7266727.1 hypothetical protein [Corynebacterium sp. ACRQJ]